MIWTKTDEATASSASIVATAMMFHVDLMHCFISPFHVSVRHRVVLLLFHHRARHNWKIAVATKKRLSDNTVLDKCQDIIDVVFWNGDLYDCPTNTKGAEEMAKFIKTLMK